MRILILTIAVLVTACTTPQPMYEWGSYQPSLLAYAKNPKDTQIFADKVAAAIKKGEATGRVPPGLYAEYGYALVELQQSEEAVIWFAKERDKWPESAFLMNRLIARLEQTKAIAPAAKSSTTPSGK